jgi:hypothetical protein
MAAPRPTLLWTTLASLVPRLETEGASSPGWEEARRAAEDATETAPDLVASLRAQDAPALRAIVAGWESGKRVLPEHDRTVLKHALKAFRKSLKLTRLDEESKIGGGPMSKGRDSGIVGITPPPHYPREIWEELVRQGRLLRQRHGTYELPPERREDDWA